MVMVLARAFAVSIAGMILGVGFAAIANKFSPNEHLLVLEGRDAFQLVVYCSAFLGGGFGAVIGAISAAAELIAAAASRSHPDEGRPKLRAPTGKPG